MGYGNYRGVCREYCWPAARDPNVSKHNVDVSMHIAKKRDSKLIVVASLN